MDHGEQSSFNSKINLILLSAAVIAAVLATLQIYRQSVQCPVFDGFLSVPVRCEFTYSRARKKAAIMSLFSEARGGVRDTIL